MHAVDLYAHGFLNASRVWVTENYEVHLEYDIFGLLMVQDPASEQDHAAEWFGKDQFQVREEPLEGGHGLEVLTVEYAFEVIKRRFASFRVLTGAAKQQISGRVELVQRDLQCAAEVLS